MHLTSSICAGLPCLSLDSNAVMCSKLGKQCSTLLFNDLAFFSDLGCQMISLQCMYVAPSNILDIFIVIQSMGLHLLSINFASAMPDTAGSSAKLWQREMSRTVNLQEALHSDNKSCPQAAGTLGRRRKKSHLLLDLLPTMGAAARGSLGELHGSEGHIVTGPDVSR